MSRILLAAKHVLSGTTHGQSIICKQLFAGHVVGSRPMERKKTNKVYLNYKINQSTRVFSTGSVFSNITFYLVSLFVYLHIPITHDAGSTDILHEVPSTFLHVTLASETL